MKRIPFMLLCLCIFTSVSAKNMSAGDSFKSFKSIEKTIAEDVKSFQLGVNDVSLNETYATTIKPNQNLEIVDMVPGGGKIQLSEFSYKKIIDLNHTNSGSLNVVSYDSINIPSDSHGVFRKGMFYGFALMLVLLNLVCFFLFEEKTYMYYSIALASTSLLLFYHDGLFSFIGIDATFGNGTIFLIIATGFTALFASKYLELREVVPKLKWIALSMIGVSTILLTISELKDVPQLLNIANILLFSVVAIYFVAGVLLFSKKNYAKFYVIASAIPLLFMLDFFLLRPLGIEFLSTQTGHIKAAAIAEMLILTYAIMYRMQALKEENALRRAELRIFLKRQEVMTTRKKTEKFVEDVYLENLIMHYDLDGLEIKLLQYISEGKENSKIARKLKVTEAEIEDYTKELYDKLEITVQIQQDHRMVESQPDYIYN